ncbi:MNIO family bufferin maturase [Sessilibacter corallicola]|uniref:MNIO family bufferin maturase n=1 Tax=Sessilibacter corallicola TaxID=2904075 RepID=UPI001E5A516E|nr:DUF692 domain-containing protein [Sessilibacter corallicola]MCE2028495.1 DUF692 domain-containing protein [Sessilibacter corallicola]
MNDSVSKSYNHFDYEYLGAGLGLRTPHIYKILAEKPKIDWLEIHICNYINGGLNQQLLMKVAENYPLSFHGVSLNLGGTEPLNLPYLKRLKQLTEEINPRLVSEHACFTAHNGEVFHDLLPVPYTEESLNHFASRISQVQEFIGRPILIENLSRYIEYPESVFTESEFLSQLCRRTGCGLLLDLTNAYVNQRNLGINLDDFVDQLPAEHIHEIHLAGYSQDSEWLVDTHSAPIPDEIWSVFQKYCARYGPRSVLIERDNNLPEFEELDRERIIAEGILNQYKVQQLENSSELEPV